MGLPLGVVLGTVGVERHQIRWTGQSAHAGSTPMSQRRDALGGVSKLHLAVREIAKRHNGVCTVGSVVTKPGIVTAVVGEATMLLDQRLLEAQGLAQMLSEAKQASERIAREENIGVEWSRIWQIEYPGWSRVYARVISEGVIRSGDDARILGAQPPAA